jgi:hypothetical protein
MLAGKRGERDVRQQVSVPRDAANRRLDRIAPQRCLEVFVEEGPELRLHGYLWSLGEHVNCSQSD